MILIDLFETEDQGVRRKPMTPLELQLSSGNGYSYAEAGHDRACDERPWPGRGAVSTPEDPRKADRRESSHGSFNRLDKNGPDIVDTGRDDCYVLIDVRQLTALHLGP